MRSKARRGREDQSVNEAHSRVAPECLRSHNARYIMLKSNYDMNKVVLIHYEAEICKRSSEAGGGESCIVKNLCMVL